MQATLHEHPLMKVDPSIVYQQHMGRWTCDNCKRVSEKTSMPYHCLTCSYDLCDNCCHGLNHPRHHHPLFYSDMAKVYPRFQGGWKCDHCGRNKSQLQQSHGYHCPIDQFDLCRECFKGKHHPIHIHHLKLENSLQIYGQSIGMWQCDSCKLSGRDIGSQYCWHCAQCEFDACDSCMKGFKLPVHPQHSLRITDSRVSYSDYNGAWKCDTCNTRGSQVTPNMDKSFHCPQCRFDVCFACVQRLTGWPTPQDVPCPVPVPPVPPCPTLPTAMPGDEEEELDESKRCVVCMFRRKNATIVHGATGHICCCIQCALQLKGQGNHCPICRAPIENIIRHYTS
eukprot:gene3553-4056_t